MTILPKEVVIDNWDVVGQALLRAIEQGGEHSLKDIRDMLDRDEVSIFQVIREGQELVGIGALSVQQTIIGGSFQRVLNICALAGDGIRPALPAMTEWAEKVARADGCVALKLTGRRGWVRRLAPLGFKKARYILHKVL